MGWATFAIERLKRGETVTIKPRGHSMAGRVEDGQEVTVQPIDPATLQVGDVVLCRVSGNEYLHLVSAIENAERFQISNNKKHVNGWVGKNCIFGKAVL